MLFYLPIPTTAYSYSDTQQNTQITTDFSARSRLESRSDRDFAQATDDDLTSLLSRARIGLSADLGNWSARLQVQLADQHAWGGGAPANTSVIETGLLYAHYADEHRQATIGRQKIALGDQRLLGPLEWANRARSFDGVRYQDGQWDAAAFGIGATAKRPPNARITYVSTDWSGGKTSYILKTDQQPAGGSTIHTLDHIWKAPLGTYMAEVEAAVQVGEAAGKDHAAYALHAALSHQVSERATVTVEANIASGGTSAGYSKTFDNLYPTNHLFYGSADLFGWRNMQEIALKSEISLDERSQLSIAAHKFWLFDAQDAWYGAGGSPNRKNGGIFLDPSGNSGRDVGAELDLNYSRRIGEGGNLSLGASIFFAGDFVKRQITGPPRDHTWLYLSYTHRF